MIQMGYLVFQTFYQVDISLHGAILGEALKSLPGIVLGAPDLIGKPRTFPSDITYSGLFVKRI